MNIELEKNRSKAYKTRWMFAFCRSFVRFVMRKSDINENEVGKRVLISTHRK